MRTCPKCKAAVESDVAKFCRHCGSPLSGTAVPYGGGAPSAPGKAPEDPSRTGQRTYVRTTEIFIPADDTPRKTRPKPQPKPDKPPVQPKPPTPKPPVLQPEEEAPTFSVPAPKPAVAPPMDPARVNDSPAKGSFGLFSAVGHVIRNYATFSGRAPRSEYWYLVLFNLLAFVAWVIVGTLLTDTVPNAIVDVWIALYAFYSLFMIVPGLAVACRRLHDTNRSGWMMLLALVPFVGAVILLIMLAQPGTPYTNTYGPPPGS